MMDLTKVVTKPSFVFKNQSESMHTNPNINYPIEWGLNLNLQWKPLKQTIHISCFTAKLAIESTDRITLTSSSIFLSALV